MLRLPGNQLCKEDLPRQVFPFHVALSLYFKMVKRSKNIKAEKA